jgi:glycosyltransferase involved in cell wall biosynthesis
VRIGYLYPFRASPPRGGNQVHAYQLVQGFLRSGHEVCTIADDSIEQVRSFAATDAGVDDLLRNVDVLYVRVDANSLLSWPAAVRSVRRAAVPVVWEINAPANERLAFSWLGGSRAPARTVIGSTVDRTRRWLHASKQLPGIMREERLRRDLAGRVHAAVCVSAPLARYAREGLGIERVTVLPNGTDPDLNHPGRTPAALPPEYAGHFKVLYAGSPMYPWQGLDVISRAVELDRGADVPIVYVLLLNQDTGMVPRGDNVLVYTGVPYRDVASYVVAADACIAVHKEFHWSKWGSHGSPMKLFDYMGCGRPVIASGVGQLEEIVGGGQAGLLFDNTPEQLSLRIRELAADPERAAVLGRNARSSVEARYNWSFITDRTLDVFEELGSGSSAAGMQPGASSAAGRGA